MKRIYLLSVLICLLSLFSFSQDILLESFGPSFSEPVEIKHAEDDRLFVVEKAGIIQILNSDGTVNSTSFLLCNKSLTADSVLNLSRLSSWKFISIFLTPSLRYNKGDAR